MFLVETVCLKRYYQVRMEKDIDMYISFPILCAQACGPLTSQMSLDFGLININYII